MGGRLGYIGTAHSGSQPRRAWRKGWWTDSPQSPQINAPNETALLQRWQKWRAHCSSSGVRGGGTVAYRHRAPYRSGRREAGKVPLKLPPEIGSVANNGESLFLLRGEGGHSAWTTVQSRSGQELEAAILPAMAVHSAVFALLVMLPLKRPNRMLLFWSTSSSKIWSSSLVNAAPLFLFTFSAILSQYVQLPT